MPADNLSEPSSADVEITERRHDGAGEDDTLASGDHAGVDENSNKDTYESDLDLGDTSRYNKEQRNQLFQRGLHLETAKRPGQALQCYLGCLRGLRHDSDFVLLPQCLHSIADIYRGQGNYESAIQFAQAEKLFYETALIETKDIQEKLEEISASEDNSPTQDLNKLNMEAMRAEEYEHLAKLCLDKKQPHLALEYAGKCTKIRQQIYGDSHEKSCSSLDMFANIYAEVGKAQYSDSIDLLTKNPVQASESEPVSILRQRNVETKDTSTAVDSDREKKQVRFHESVEESIKVRENEEFASMTIMLIVLAILFVILASMGMWLYCSIHKDEMCQSISTHLHQWLRHIQFNLRSLTSTFKS